MTDLFREFSMNAMGIRASGAAAVNLCHLAAGEFAGVVSGSCREVASLEYSRCIKPD
jgi:fructose-1,6-bisphosphatase/inositol monophosphatase family enzyme